jgi:alpha-ribazole phosphatase
MKIFLIRHGETDWNVQQRYQGQTDIRLNAYGREHARVIAGYLTDKNIEAIYSSDLARTRETAEIISRVINREVRLDSRLREMDFGRWEGKTFNEIYLHDRQQFNNWFNHTVDYIIPGGESFESLADRAGEAIKDICDRHEGNIAVVTHGGVIKAILYNRQLIGAKELWGGGTTPGSITILDVDNKEYKIVTLS